MISLTAEDVLLLHEKLIAATGGHAGLRDRGLLESAVWSMDAAFGGMEQYPTVEEKAARLAFGLVRNHAFVDGNKRVGVLALLTMLTLNHVPLRYTQQELIALGLGLASGALDYRDALEWIWSHKERAGS